MMEVPELDPLIAMRPKLVAERRTAARERSFDGTIKVQDAIETVV